MSSTCSAGRFIWRKLDDTLIVVDQPVFEFTVLNKTAGAIWLCLLDQDWRISDLLDYLYVSFLDSRTFAASDLNGILETWFEKNWLQKSQDGTIRISSKPSVLPNSPIQTITKSMLNAKVSGVILEWSIIVNFIGSGVEIRFHCDPDLVNNDTSVRMKTLLNGLPQRARNFSGCIECYLTREGIFLRQGETYLKAEDKANGINWLILWCFHSAYGRNNFLGMFHAAAIARDNGAILMPGLSGAGKSTLAAYLAQNNWLYGGDDTVGLSKSIGPDCENLILPFCSALSVKNGALDFLTPFYPELEELPLLGYGSKTARFPCVPFENQMTPDPKQRRVRAIVFPTFEQSVEPALVSLSIKETLLTLINIGFRFDERADKTALENLFQFLENTPKYRLTFSSCQDAHHLLEGLL